MSHLNELESEFSARGLSVIGVTGETPAQTEPWIAKHKASYAYAYDPGMDLMRAVGTTSYPSAALISPDGRVVWSGHPSSINASIIEPNLEGAVAKPMWEWPAETKDLQKLLRKGDYAKAVAAADQLAGNGGELEIFAKVVRDLVAAKAASVERAHEAGDFLTAETLGDQYAKSLKGLPELDRIEAVRAAIKANANAKKIIKAQKEILAIEEELPKLNRAKKIEEAMGKLSSIAKKVPDSFAAKRAESLKAQLEKALQGAK